MSDEELNCSECVLELLFSVGTDTVNVIYTTVYALCARVLEGSRIWIEEKRIVTVLRYYSFPDSRFEAWRDSLDMSGVSAV